MKKSFYLSSVLAAASSFFAGGVRQRRPAARRNPTSRRRKLRQRAVEKTLFVGPTLVDCEGVAPQKCMLVMDNPDDGYQMFYGNIEGFDFEEGFEYELIVRVEEIENPPADASSLKYTLVSVVNKSPATPTANPEVSMPTQTYTLDWYLNAQGEQTAVLPGTEITLAFMDGRVAGNSGCNQYSGGAEINGNQIKLGGMMSTMMACEETIMQQEQAYLAALGSAASFEISGETLTMADAQGNVVLSFSTLQPASLVGTQWNLTMYNNGKQALVSRAEWHYRSPPVSARMET